MKSCAYLTPDDYPCLAEGTKKVGTKWYCEDHAIEAELDEMGFIPDEAFEDVLIDLDDEVDNWIDQCEAADNCD